MEVIFSSDEDDSIVDFLISGEEVHQEISFLMFEDFVDRLETACHECGSLVYEGERVEIREKSSFSFLSRTDFANLWPCSVLARNTPFTIFRN